MRRTGTTRRGALTATGGLALGAVLTGCSNGTDAGGRKDSAATRARAASLLAQRTLRTDAARTSASLLAVYDRTLTAHPATAAGLAPLRAAVQEHTKALAPNGAGPVRPARRPTTAPAPAPGPGAALKELAAEERRVADAHTKSLLDAEPELARLLASIAAAGAAHAYLLTELAKKETSS